MTRTIHLARLLACGALAITGAAQAATTWYFNEVTFADASLPAMAHEQAVGWFTYDKASNTVTDWDLSVKTVGSDSAGFIFDETRMRVTVNAYSQSVSFQAMGNDASMYGISFGFPAESLKTASNQLTLTSGSISHGWRGRVSSLVSGSLTTSPVPEINTGVAFAMGLLGLALMARRRQG